MLIRLNNYDGQPGWWRHIFSRSTQGNYIIRLGRYHHLWIFKHKPIDK